MRVMLALALLLVSATPARADWSAPVVLSDVGGITQGTQRAAGNAAGDAVVVWRRSDRLEFAGRTAGGPFAPPVTLARDSTGDAEVALNDAGTVAVVWSIGRELKGINGRPFTIGGSGCSLAVQGVVVDAAGRATVFWTDCDQFLHADVGPDGGVGAPQPLPAKDPLVAAAPDGTVALAWTEALVTRVAVRPPGGAFTYGEAPVGPLQGPLYLAAGRGGGAAVAWGDSRGEIFAAVRRPGGALGPPVAIAPPGKLHAITIDDAGAATAIRADTRSLWAVAIGGGTQKIADGEACRVHAAVDVAGALYVAGDTDCGGARIWGAVRPAGGVFAGQVTALGPQANNHPPSLVASGAGAVVAWPIGTSPPRAKHVMTAVAFRATPLVAFASEPRVRDGRLRVRVKTSAAVTVTLRVVVGRRAVATVRRRVSGTRTFAVRRPRGARSARVILTVRGGDEVVRRVRLA